MVPYNISRNGSTCRISNLKLSKDEKFVLPKQYKNVKHLYIEYCTIPRLTEDLVGAFPNLYFLSATDNGIEEVSEDAFVGCKFLTKIILEENHIKTLEKNTFNRNTRLIQLSLNNNEIDCLPKEIFTNLKDLQYLYVIGNQLLDLEIDEILKQCPNLTHFAIGDNDFSLSVLQKIQKALKTVSYAYEYMIWMDGTKRSRPYEIGYLDGIEYIPDAEYERLLTKKKEEAVQKPREEEKLKILEQKTNLTMESMQNHVSKNTQEKSDSMEQKLVLMQNCFEAIQNSREEDKKIMQEKMESMQNCFLDKFETFQKSQKEEQKLVEEKLVSMQTIQKTREEEKTMMEDKFDLMQQKMTLMMESMQNGLLEKFETIQKSREEDQKLVKEKIDSMEQKMASLQNCFLETIQKSREEDQKFLQSLLESKRSGI